MLSEQGDLEAALKAYQDSLAIRERLAKGDPDNTKWQRDVAASNGFVATVLIQQGNLDAALKAHQMRTETVRKILGTAEQVIEKLVEKSDD